MNWKVRLPDTKTLHEEDEFTWKSYKVDFLPSDGSEANVDEPTAAECDSGKGTELSRGRRRLGRSPRAHNVMRVWVPDQSQAGLRKGPQLFVFRNSFSFQASCMRWFWPNYVG